MSPASSTVDHPAHYNVGRIEVIDFIEDQRLGFHLGNAIKYVCRAERKGAAVDDLEKAIWYLRREVQRRRWPGLTSKEAQARERGEPHTTPPHEARAHSEEWR